MDERLLLLRRALAEWDKYQFAKSVMKNEGIDFSEVLTRRAAAMEQIIATARIVACTDQRKTGLGRNLMGWAVGYDTNWKRDIGYGVPANCDYPGCEARIDRGLAYVCCDQEPYGGEGCGLFFCSEHADSRHRCERCDNDEPPFNPSPDRPEWIEWKLTDISWEAWRVENPTEVAKLYASLTPTVPTEPT